MTTPTDEARELTVAWISVTDRLPPRHKNVWCLNADGRQFEGRICFGMHEPFFTYPRGDGNPSNTAPSWINVTHWRELPSPPSSEDTGKENCPKCADWDRLGLSSYCPYHEPAPAPSSASDDVEGMDPRVWADLLDYWSLPDQSGRREPRASRYRKIAALIRSLVEERDRLKDCYEQEVRRVQFEFSPALSAAKSENERLREALSNLADHMEEGLLNPSTKFETTVKSIRDLLQGKQSDG